MVEVSMWRPIRRGH